MFSFISVHTCNDMINGVRWAPLKEVVFFYCAVQTVHGHWCSLKSVSPSVAPQLAWDP